RVDVFAAIRSRRDKRWFPADAEGTFLTEFFGGERSGTTMGQTGRAVPDASRSFRRGDADDADRFSPAHSASTYSCCGRKLGAHAPLLCLRRSALFDGDRLESPRGRAVGHGV